jgi:hypothetical protein
VILLGLSPAERRDVCYLAVLRHVGSTSNSHDDAQKFGNELSALTGLTLIVFDGTERTEPAQ